MPTLYWCPCQVLKATGMPEHDFFQQQPTFFPRFHILNQLNLY